MITLRLSGNTFEYKDDLKAVGFKWNRNNRFWYKDYEDAEREAAEELAKAYTPSGIFSEIVAKADPNERKYYVKESWRFNLESMNDKIWCLIYDADDHKIDFPIEGAGKKIADVCGLYDLLNEVQELTGAANYRVDGKTYGRIREVVGWRINARYAACMAAGMDERDAGMCFEDM